MVFCIKPQNDSIFSFSFFFFKFSLEIVPELCLNGWDMYFRMTVIETVVGRWVETLAGFCAGSGRGDYCL